MFGLKKLRIYSQKNSDTWIKSTLEKVDLLIPKPSDSHIGVLYSTKRDSNEIRYSLKEDESDAHYSIDEMSLKMWEQSHCEKTFQEQLFELIKAKKMSNREFYKQARIDRRLFSAIRRDKNYHPKKDTVLASCLALNLTLDETKDLLDRSGYSLSLSIEKDRIIYYCIENKIYDLDSVNDLLNARKQNCFL